jgi:hypothetical protein
MDNKKTVDEIVAICNAVLINYGIADEDIKQDTYLFALNNFPLLSAGSDDDIKIVIKNYIDHAIDTANNQYTLHKIPSMDTKYDIFKLYDIAADLIFNKLDEPHKMAIIIKYDLEPDAEYNEIYTQEVVNTLVIEALALLTNMANEALD